MGEGINENLDTPHNRVVGLLVSGDGYAKAEERMSWQNHIYPDGELVWPFAFPTPYIQQWGVQEGSAIQIIPQGEQIMLCKKTYDLDDMLAQITPENLHTEQSSGAPRGREEW